MRKNRWVPAVILLIAVLLSGCCMSHKWREATCEAPRTCENCGETEGEKSEHNWEPATCEQGETCSMCGQTRGEPLGHDWQDASCAKPKHCALCGKKEGEPLEHDYAVTAMRPESYTSTCVNCGAILSEMVEASYWDAKAPEAILGKWHAVMMQRNERYFHIKTDQELSVEFFPDGILQLVMGTQFKSVGKWEFAEVREEDGLAVMFYKVIMPEETLTYSIRTFPKEKFENFPDVQIPEGYTLISHPEKENRFEAYYTRQGLTHEE